MRKYVIGYLSNSKYDKVHNKFQYKVVVLTIGKVRQIKSKCKHVTLSPIQNYIPGKLSFGGGTAKIVFWSCSCVMSLWIWFV